jgi:CubicO group peptidase (beta-lactamase class C family)
MRRFGPRGFVISIVCAGLLALGFVGLQITQTATSLQATPPAFVPPLLDREQVDYALSKLDGIVADAMERTGIPGIAVAVVYQDEVVYAKGFGLREVGKPDQIDTDTVFQLASVSKPIASTIVAEIVGRGLIAWDDPVKKHNPSFKLSDPYVTEHATFADLLSHRSGLLTGDGDLLEDLGYDRAYILDHLDQQSLDQFRSTYNYSNFGYTAGGEAAAIAAGTTWEDLADTVLFKPLGMTRSSYRHADYKAHKNKALIHVRNKGAADSEWSAKYDREPDPEAPAGGASASINDIAKYLRLQLNGGTFEDQEIINANALATTHAPHQITGPPRTPLSRASFYGLGWGASYDDLGRVKMNHSGAFFLGASTNVSLLPGENLGIAVLTNGEPIGVPEGIANSFLDIAQNGALSVDWTGFYGMMYQAMHDGEALPTDYTIQPGDAKPPGALGEYAGTYGNTYYGPLVVKADGDRLVMSLGPESAPNIFVLTPYDGDTFSFETIGENAVGLAGVAFGRNPDGTVSSAVIDFYDQTGLGTFKR